MSTGRWGNRFSLKKEIVAFVGVSAMILASLAAGVSAAQATSGTDPVFGEWTQTGYTEWQPDPNTPADPDGQDGEDNILNVVQLGEREEQHVPGDTRVENTDWVLEAPAGEGWELVDETTVTDEPAIETIVVDKPAHWQRYSWTGGPHSSHYPPPFPSSKWQKNVEGDPHGIGQEGAYYRSHGGSGKGDWFYLEWVEAKTHVETTPAVTHQEYKYQREVQEPGHTEYRWSIWERVNTPGEPGEPTEPTEPTEPEAEDTSLSPSHANKGGKQAANRELPLSIDAGL